MRRGWIIGAIVAIVLLGGGVALVAIDRRRMAQLLRDAFARYGMPAAWGEAFGIMESNLDSTAVVRTGTDGARGGAFGPTQITAKTLRAHGGDFDPERLRSEPELAAEWTARIMAAGRPRTIEDAGAWWNAGRYSFSQLPDGHVTREKYVPRLREILGRLA